MNTPLKSIIGICAAALISFVAYYGTYLPMRKSQAFIRVMQTLPQQKSTGEVQRVFLDVLTMPSPIGQEELVRNITNLFLGAIQQTDDPTTISQSVDFVTQHFKPIIEYGRGMSFGQNLYILGAMNEVAFVKTKQIKYLENAKRYYTKGLELGPSRPQPLYGLFDVYRMEGNVEKVKEITDKILSQWPEDKQAKAGLEEFLQKVAEFQAQNR